MNINCEGVHVILLEASIVAVVSVVIFVVDVFLIFNFVLIFTCGQIGFVWQWFWWEGLKSHFHVKSNFS